MFSGSNMALESFEQIFNRAAQRKGGKDNLQQLLAQVAVNEQLAELSDDRVLAAFTKKIFQSGFVWSVVEKKWPEFEQLFFNFDLEKILMMPAEMLEQKASDPRIIRNFNKVKTIKANAQMMFEHTPTGQNFAQLIAAWPSDNIIALWAFLKQHGERLGGNTGPYALRALGKDTFLLSRDVEAYFRAQQLITGGLQTKASLHAIQAAFNQWHQQSSMPYAMLSRLIALSTGDNQIQVESV
jgi:3-methyladenine DNA glycosylase Tag